MWPLRTRSSAAFVASLLLLGAGPAWAGNGAARKGSKAHSSAGASSGDAAADARRFFEAAQKAFDAGRYVDAARAFEDAFHLKPHPAPLINAGDAWEKAGEYAKAAQDFQQVLGLKQSTDQDRADAIDRLARLKPQLGTIELLGKAGQRVRVDDNEFKGGDKVYVFPGKHKVTLLDVDGARLRTLDVAAGTVRSVELSTLMPTEEEIQQQHASHAGGGAHGGGGGIRPLTWVAYGVGVVGLAGTAVFGLQANSAANSFDQNPNRDDYDRFNQDKLLTNISLGVGVVGVGVGTVLLLSDLKRSRTAPQSDTSRTRHGGSVAVDVAPLPRGGGMVTARGRF
jgi:tetratricopeptide (TPR) repeat protein